MLTVGVWVCARGHNRRTCMSAVLQSEEILQSGTIEQLLGDVIGRAGVNTTTGRGGPRIHDLRHTFVVHRMTTWYRQGMP
jgi:integrase